LHVEGAGSDTRFRDYDLASLFRVVLVSTQSIDLVWSRLFVLLHPFLQYHDML